MLSLMGFPHNSVPAQRRVGTMWTSEIVGVGGFDGNIELPDAEESHLGSWERPTGGMPPVCMSVDERLCSLSTRRRGMGWRRLDD